MKYLLVVPCRWKYIYVYWLVRRSLFILASNAFFLLLWFYAHSALACESFFTNFSNSKATKYYLYGWLNFAIFLTCNQPRRFWSKSNVREFLLFSLLLFGFCQCFENCYVKNIVRVVNFSMPCLNCCLRPLHVWNFTTATMMMLMATAVGEWGRGTIKTISLIFKPSTHNTFTYYYYSTTTTFYQFDLQMNHKSQPM